MTHKYLMQYSELTEQAEVDWERVLYSFGDWVNGDAMKPINDDGERFSVQPYYDSMRTLARRIGRPQNLGSMLYRGYGFDDNRTFSPGLIQTAKKRFQSWTTSAKEAAKFARGFGGHTGIKEYKHGVIFCAPVADNAQNLVLYVPDVLAFLPHIKDQISSNCFNEIEYQLTNYADQHEVIIRGTTVMVSHIKVIQ